MFENKLIQPFQKNTRIFTEKVEDLEKKNKRKGIFRKK